MDIDAVKQRELKVLTDLEKLGIQKEIASEMLETYIKFGGLSCVLKWPIEFSFFCNRRNVLDVLLENSYV